MPKETSGGSLLRFAALVFGAFAARSLLAALVLVDLRLGAVALLAFLGSNLPALLYLRANADRVFPPVKAEQATKLGMEHVLDRYGVTKRERQIVQKICLGKTNQADRRGAVHQPADREGPHPPHLLEDRHQQPDAARADDEHC